MDRNQENNNYGAGRGGGSGEDEHYADKEEDAEQALIHEGDSLKKPGAFSLFLGDLSYFCAEADLQKAFAPFGEILDIRVIRNKATRKSLSYGFIDYSNASAAAAAMKEMNGKLVCGRAIRIKWASVAGNKEKELEAGGLAKFCLYVGDISLDMDEDTLRLIFQRYGELISLKLKTKQTEKGPVNFAFIEYSNASSAVNAMKELDGNTTYGSGSRPLRVRWASNATAGSPTGTQKGTEGERMKNPAIDDNSAVSIFTSFQTTRPDIVVTDEILRYIFGRYGQIADVAIRLSVKDPDTHLQRGYAFVCFQNSNQGITAAMRVTNEMANCEVDGVMYKCEVSRRLVQKLGTSKGSNQTIGVPNTVIPQSSHHPHSQHSAHIPHVPPHHQPPAQQMAMAPMMHPQVLAPNRGPYYGNQVLGPEGMITMQNVSTIPTMAPWPANLIWNPGPAYPPQSQYSVHPSAPQPHPYPSGYIQYHQPLDPNNYNPHPMNPQHEQYRRDF